MAPQVAPELRNDPAVAPRLAGSPRIRPATGVSTIAVLTLRQRARVCGRVVSATTRRWGSGVTYECVLDDGGGELLLAFLGRRRVPGLVVDSRIWARGIVAEHRGRRLMWNPEYGFELANPTSDSDA